MDTNIVIIIATSCNQHKKLNTIDKKKLHLTQLVHLLLYYHNNQLSINSISISFTSSPEFSGLASSFSLIFFFGSAPWFDQ